MEHIAILGLGIDADDVAQARRVVDALTEFFQPFDGLEVRSVSLAPPVSESPRIDRRRARRSPTRLTTAQEVHHG